MFTGIIEEVGTVDSIHRQGDAFALTIKATRVLEGTRIGDSICTDGICLTVTQTGKGFFTVDVMPETVNRSTISEMKPGTRVNLERALRLSDRLGGHLLSGHIDGTGRITGKFADGNARIFRISCEAGLERYMVEKGSVAVDGISVTIIDTGIQSFSVGLIPHTQEVTALLMKQPGSRVNIECDLIAKYVEKLFVKKNPASGISLDKLGEEGFL